MKKISIVMSILAVLLVSLFLLLKGFTQEQGSKNQEALAQTEEAERKMLESAESLFVAKKYDEAIMVYKQLIATYRNGLYREKAQLRIGDCFLEKNDFRMARTTFMLFIANNQQSVYLADAYYRMGDAFLREKSEENALDAYKYAFNNYPDYVRGEKTLFWIAGWYFQKGLYDQAIENFVRLSEWFPDDEFTDQAFYYLALSHFKKQEYRQCREYLSIFFKKFPVSRLVPACYLMLGDSYQDYLDYPLKEKAYRDLLERKPLDRVAFDRLGDVYRALQLYGKAISLYDQGIKPAYDDYIKEYGSRYLPRPDTALEQKRPRGDSDFFNDSLTQEIALKKCACLLALNDKAQALEILKKFIQAAVPEQKLRQAYCLMAGLYYDEGDYAQAGKFYQVVPDEKCPALKDLYRKGLSALKTRQYYLAIDIFKKVVDRWEKSTDEEKAMVKVQLAYFALADALYSENRFLEAIRYYRMVQDYSQDYVLYRLAKCYQTLGMRQETTGMLQQLAQKYPSQLVASQTAAAADTTWQSAYLNYMDKIVGYSPF